MRVVMCQAHDARYAEMAAITAPINEAYCKKHGYEFLYLPDRDEREGDSCKINIFKALYASGQYGGDDVFFWIDTDAMVMNSEIKIEELFDLELHYIKPIPHYWVGYDVNGLNTGTWMARFTSHANHFLTVALNQSIAMGWADQEGLFQTMLKEPFKHWVRQIPGKAMNAMPYELYGWDSWAHKNEINNYEPGDFILHTPGLEMSKRVEVLRHYAKLAV